MEKIIVVEQQSLFHKSDNLKEIISNQYYHQQIMSYISLCFATLCVLGIDYCALIFTDKLLEYFLVIVACYFLIFGLNYFILKKLLFFDSTPFLKFYTFPKTHVYSPYTIEPHELKNNQWYNRAKNNIQTIFVDPLYIGRLNPKGAKLLLSKDLSIDAKKLLSEELPLKWIPYEQKGNIKKGLFFAVFPLTTIVTQHNALVLRVFIANLSNKEKKVKLRYTLDTLHVHSKIRTLVSTHVDSRSIYYSDICVPSKYISIIGDTPRIFRIVDAWDKTTGWFSRVTTTTYYQRNVAIFPYIFLWVNIGKITSPSELQLLLNETDYFGILNNKYVAPTAIKEIIAFSLSRGILRSKEDYLWERSKMRYFLIFVTFFSILAFDGYCIYVTVSEYFNFVIILFLFAILFSDIVWLLKHRINFIGKINAKMLYKVGLIKNENYVTEEDLVDIAYNKEEIQWLLLALITKRLKRIGVHALPTISLNFGPFFQPYATEKEANPNDNVLYTALYYSPNFKEMDTWQKIHIDL